MDRANCDELFSYNCVKQICYGAFSIMGRGGVQVVNVLAFYSYDLSSNPAVDYSFFSKICVFKERK